MTITVKHKYLVFPVGTLSAEKLLSFSENDKILYKLKIKIDNINPDFYSYVDLSRFMGKTLNIGVEPEMELCFTESDELDPDNLYSETLRPQIHFSTKNGWVNDPNGLLYFNGYYHLFYQHNPCEPTWGNMHWGHAVSKDMIHWKEENIALFPDDTGMMFSGSGIVDSENRLGLGDKDKPVALLFYTATNGFNQRLAYFQDDYNDIKKYEEKPALPRYIGSNRDPSIAYVEELSAYVIALFIDKDRYALFKSNSFTEWELMQEISIPEERECPDLFSIVASDGKKKWLLSGAHGKYLVGDFLDGKYVASQEVKSLQFGLSAYAGQSFSSVPGDRVVRLDWHRWYIKTPRFYGQMGIPTELSLKAENGEYLLCALPIREIESLYDGEEYYENISFDENTACKIPLQKRPYHIKLSASVTDKNNVLTFSVFGRIFICNLLENTLKIGENIGPLTQNPDKIDIDMIVDKCSIELYLDGGKITFATAAGFTVSDYNLPYLVVNSTANFTIDTVELHPLKSIWKEN